MPKFDRSAEALFLWKRYGEALIDDYQPDPLVWRVEWPKGRSKRPVLWLSPQLYFDLEPKMKSWLKAWNKAQSRAASR